MNLKSKSTVIFISILLVIIIFSILFYYISPNEIVENIGIKNTYWLIFLIGILSGVSTFTSTGFYATLIILTAGGSNPYLLGLSAGAALTVGDSLFYYLGKNGSKSLPNVLKKYSTKTKKWFDDKPNWILLILIYIYTGLTPLPGDILNIFLGIGNFKYKNVIFPIILGNITLMILLGVLAQNGIKIFN